MNPGDGDVRSIFSAERTVENHKYLRARLGARFIAQANHAPRFVKHPVLTRWTNSGIGSHLELNALAEDLRVVESAPGLPEVLEDLRNAARCMATWHTIHSAALLSRADGVQLVRFFPQTEDSAPDFLIRTDSGEFACEAKLLDQSDIARQFSVYAKSLSDAIELAVFQEAKQYPQITLVLKDAEHLPQKQEILSLLKQGVASFSGPPLAYRSSTLNVFLEAPSVDFDTFTEVRAINVLAKKSDREDIRVVSRGKEASRQLRSEAAKGHPGLLILSVGDIHDPEFIEELFRNRFVARQYSGISAAMLLRSGTHTHPPEAAPIDLLSIVRNPMAERSLPNTPLHTIGLIGRLRDTLPKPNVPAYRFQMIKGTIKSIKANAEIGFQDLRLLTPEMLAD